MPYGPINKKKGISILFSSLLILTIVTSITLADSYEKQDDNICPCNLMSYDYGNWSFSEHIYKGNLEEDWCECNETYWEPYNLFSAETTYDIIDNEGDGVIDTGALTFLGDDSDDELILSEFLFIPNVSGDIFEVNVYINHTIG